MRAIRFSSLLGSAALTLAIGLGVAACGGEAADDGAAEGGAAESGSVIGTVTGDLIVVDRDQMAELPCHAMDNTIMGTCSEEDIDNVLTEMGLSDAEVVIHDLQTMSDQDCHVMENAVMGNCAEADVATFADEIRANR